MPVFAGPNGSGKSTIKDELKPAWIGACLNADDIEQALREGQGVSLPKLGLAGQGEGLLAALQSELAASSLLITELEDGGQQLRLHADRLPAWLERSSLWDAFRPDPEAASASPAEAP